VYEIVAQFAQNSGARLAKTYSVWSFMYKKSSMTEIMTVLCQNGFFTHKIWLNG